MALDAACEHATVRRVCGRHVRTGGRHRRCRVLRNAHVPSFRGNGGLCDVGLVYHRVSLRRVCRDPRTHGCSDWYGDVRVKGGVATCNRRHEVSCPYLTMDTRVSAWADGRWGCHLSVLQVQACVSGPQEGLWHQRLEERDMLGGDKLARSRGPYLCDQHPTVACCAHSGLWKGSHECTHGTGLVARVYARCRRCPHELPFAILRRAQVHANLLVRVDCVRPQH